MPASSSSDYFQWCNCFCTSQVHLIIPFILCVLSFLWWTLWGASHALTVKYLCICSIAVKEGDKSLHAYQKILILRLIQRQFNILLWFALTSASYAEHKCNNVLQVLIENGIPNCLAQLLARNYPKNIKKQACLIVSNIATGNKEQIQVS